MGYDVRITRAEHWTQSMQVPITASEWIYVVASDISVRIDTDDYAEMRDLETGCIRRIHPVVWHGPPDEPACLWFDQREVEVKSPDDATVSKMVALAARLNARVMGDDGELYE